MSTVIDLTESKRIEILSFDEIDAKKIVNKGWSFSYVYNFSEIKDIYLTLKLHDFKGLRDFEIYCASIKLPYVKTPWNKRRLLEHLNALKNFGLINSDYRIIKQEFLDSTIGSELTSSDLLFFRRIYFDYFRFKEMFSWFIEFNSREFDSISKLSEQEIIEKTKPLYVFSHKSRFTDSFITELRNNTTVHFIDNENKEDLMRFWDVFIKWGTTLGVLEKFNLRNIGYKTIDDEGIACVYLIRDNVVSINILQYIRTNNLKSYIYLPDLVLKIATEFRMRIEKVQQLIIEEYKRNKEYLSMERTSEVFIKKGDIGKNDTIFFPKYNDAFISHLIVRE